MHPAREWSAPELLMVGASRHRLDRSNPIDVDVFLPSLIPDNPARHCCAVDSLSGAGCLRSHKF